MSSSKLNGALVAAAAAMLIAGCASPAKTAGSSGSKAEVKCYGQNACKQTADCKTAANACKGQNACKAQGFMLLPKAACDTGTIKS